MREYLKISQVVLEVGMTEIKINRGGTLFNLGINRNNRKGNSSLLRGLIEINVNRSS